ncbi:MAG: hypothetical protein RLZ92_728 [Pseudomonadota bacterium]
MKKLISTVICLSVFSLLPAIALAGNDDHASSSIPRQLLLKKRVTLTSNSVDSKVIRVQFPKGYKTPAHTHEGPGPRYVVKGKLRVEDNGESNVFSAGEVFWETGGLMTVENIGDDQAEIIIFEMVAVK